tara:strand:- start:846 stop:1037 length:192 start_codon:yes stop_codon:yes gene_type:complete
VKRGDKVEIIRGGHTGEQGSIIWVFYDSNQVTVAPDTSDGPMVKLSQDWVEIIHACNMIIPMV